MVTIKATSFSKRRNSTKRPTSFTADFQVSIKANCDWNSPIFLLNASNFPYNYIQWGNQYYFVETIAYVKNDLLEVSCVTDVLATYKEEILASTQFVSYSNVSGGTWLRDTRLPVLSDCIIAKNEVNAPFISTGSNKYILSVIGKSGGCALFALTRSQINTMLDNVESQNGEIVDTLMEDSDWDSVETALQSLTKIMTQTDLLGNAYENAPSCVRSCFWTPFVLPSGGEVPLYLGNYDTHVNGWKLFDTLVSSAMQINIPWHYSDWRRSYCESIYLYLPFVGMINIPTSEITSVTQITIKYSYTITDGAISYEVLAGNEIIGTYGGSCAAQYPIGINQQASVGSVATTLMNGAVNTANTAIFGVVPNAATAVNAVSTAYNTADTAFSTHPSSIGGMGGGSGAGLDMKVICVSVAHSTIIEPSAMQSTMGVPTMKPLQLSSCSGYVQCANAHVSAVAHSDELDMIDTYLNSGFYIE